MNIQLRTALIDTTQALDRLSLANPIEERLHSIVTHLLDQLKNHRFTSSADHIVCLFFVARLTALGDETMKAQCCCQRILCSRRHPVLQWNHALVPHHRVPVAQALLIEQVLNDSVTEKQQCRNLVVRMFRNALITANLDLIIEALQEFAKTEYTDRENLLTHMEPLLYEGISPQELGWIMHCIRGVPVPLREMAVQAIMMVLHRDETPIAVKQNLYLAFLAAAQEADAQDIFSSPPTLRKHVRDHLRMILQRQQDLSLAVLRSLLNFFLYHGFLLGITHDHPMIEELSQSLAAKGYRDIRYLQTLLQRNAPQNSTILPEPPLIQQESRVTYANLTLFPSSHLSDLLNELEAHIDELSPVQEQLYFAEFFPLHEYEQTALYSFIVRLRTPLTQEESSLYKWMHFPQGEDDEPIPLPVYHLQWILQACTSQAVEQSQDLSDQERLLIRFVIFMHHYLDVKEEGLSAFYQELFPVQFTPDADKPVLGYFSFFTKKEACRRSFWLSSPQSPFLQNIFPSTFQIQTEESRHLLMHQTVYLKNLLSKELGIPHQLVINPINEAYVHSSLLQKTKSDLLRSFFSLYTVAYVINAFQKQLQKDLNEPLFMAIDQFARDRQSKKPKNFWMQHENELTVTEQGARWLLQEAGILTNSSG